MNKPKIAIVVPCWGRHEVVEIVAKQLDIFSVKTQQHIDTIVIYVFSPEDNDIEKLEEVFKKASHQRDKTYYPNKNLGAKLDSGIKFAKKYGYDYIMNFGSDDLLSPKIIEYYLPYIKSRCHIFGINQLYFYHPEHTPVLFKYYNQPNVIGAARMIHKTVINTVIKLYGGLYDPIINRGMDTMSAHRMLKCGYQQTIVDIADLTMLVDVKSDTNINSFEKITKEISRKTEIKSKKKYSKILENEFPILKQYNEKTKLTV